MRTFSVLLSSVLLAASSVAAQTPSLQVIAPTATNQDLGPRTLSGAIVSCTDLPTSTMPDTSLRILSGHAGDTHTVYAPGEIVVLSGGTPRGLAAGQRFFTRRLQIGFEGEPPSTSMHGALRTSGWVTVVAADEHFALARVEFACDNVEADDFLAPYVEPVFPTKTAADGPPNFSDMGRVLFGADRRQTFGPGDVTNIDRGTSHGIGIGTRVAFYRDRLNGTPLVEMGAGVVIETTTDTAKVVLVRARDAVSRGDYVVVRGTPAAPQ